VTPEGWKERKPGELVQENCVTLNHVWVSLEIKIKKRGRRTSKKTLIKGKISSRGWKEGYRSACHSWVRTKKED